MFKSPCGRIISMPSIFTSLCAPSILSFSIPSSKTDLFRFQNNNIWPCLGRSLPTAAQTANNSQAAPLASKHDGVWGRGLCVHRNIPGGGNEIVGLTWGRVAVSVSQSDITLTSRPRLKTWWSQWQQNENFGIVFTCADIFR